MKTGSRLIWNGVYYPILMSAAIGAPLAMMASGLSVLSSTYIPVVVAAVIVTVLELCNPERIAWKPTRKDVVDDTVRRGRLHRPWRGYSQALALRHRRNRGCLEHMQCVLWPDIRDSGIPELRICDDPLMSLAPIESLLPDPRDERIIAWHGARAAFNHCLAAMRWVAGDLKLEIAQYRFVSDDAASV